MRQSTRWALTVVATMAMTTCSGTPAKQVEGLIDTYERTARYMGEVYSVYLLIVQATYDGLSVDCGPQHQASGLTTQDRTRYSGAESTRLRELEKKRLKAGTTCHDAQVRAQGALQTLQTIVDDITEEKVKSLGNRFRLELGRLDQESIRLLLENADSDEDAWKSMLTPLGYGDHARILTRDQVDPRLEDDKNTVDGIMTELRSAMGGLAQAREKWEPVLAEIKSGTWEAETNQ